MAQRAYPAVWGTSLVLTASLVNCIMGEDKPGAKRWGEDGSQGERRGKSNPSARQPIDSKSTSQIADEESIRSTATDFVKAYSEGDYKALSRHFTTDAEYVDENGNIFEGREAIENAFKLSFEQWPGSTIELNIENIRFISPTVAMEGRNDNCRDSRRSRRHPNAIFSCSRETERPMARRKRQRAGRQKCQPEPYTP